jgi:hypothetical protein
MFRGRQIIADLKDNEEAPKSWLKEMERLAGLTGVVVTVDSDAVPPQALVRVDEQNMHEW